MLKIYKLVLFGYCIMYIHCTVVLATNNYYRRWKQQGTTTNWGSSNQESQVVFCGSCR